MKRLQNRDFEHSGTQIGFFTTPSPSAAASQPAPPIQPVREPLSTREEMLQIADLVPLSARVLYSSGLCLILGAVALFAILTTQGPSSILLVLGAADFSLGLLALVLGLLKRTRGTPRQPESSLPDEPTQQTPPASQLRAAHRTDSMSPFRRAV